MSGGHYVDITHLFAYPQSDVAEMLDMKQTTFSHRWKEVVIDGRRWPHRILSKNDSQITNLLRSIDAADADDDGRSMETLGNLIVQWHRSFQPPVKIRVGTNKKGPQSRTLM